MSQSLADNVVSIRIFLEVFVKYAASIMYSHHLLLSMIPAGSNTRAQAIKEIHAHTQSRLSAVWDETIEKTPTLQAVEKINDLKKSVLACLKDRKEKFNFFDQINTLFDLIENNPIIAKSMSRYFYFVLEMIIKFKLHKETDGKQNAKYALLREKTIKLAADSMRKGSQTNNPAADIRKDQYAKNMKSNRWARFFLLMGLILNLYAVQDLTFGSNSRQSNYAIFAGTFLLNYIMYAQAAQQAQMEIEASIIFKYVGRDLKISIKNELLTVLSVYIPKAKKTKPIIHSELARQATSDVASNVALQPSLHATQSAYEGTSLPVQKRSKNTFNTTLKSTLLAPPVKNEPTHLVKPTQWDFNGEGELQEIMSRNDTATFYLINTPDGHQYLFYNREDWIDNQQFNALEHIAQDGKTIRTDSKGRNGIKVYSTQASSKNKEASAVIKVSDQRLYCRAVNGFLSNRQKCVIHIPVVMDKKNKVSMSIKR